MKTTYFIQLAILASFMVCVYACGKETESLPEPTIELQDNMTVELINTYVDQWNEQNEGKRLKILEQIWSEEGLFVDPFGHRGHGAAYLNTVIENDRQQNQGISFSIEDVYVFEKTGFWTWRLYNENQEEIIWGYDYAELDEEGKIKLLVVFSP